MPSESRNLPTPGTDVVIFEAKAHALEKAMAAETRAVTEAHRLIGALDESIQRQLIASDRMLQERYETQMSGLSVRRAEQHRECCE